MITVGQMQRLWDGRKYQTLLDGLLSPRVESALAEDLGAAGSLAAAAMGLIRLDELNQTHVPLFGKFIRAILAAQQSDGGWGDLAVTAVCLRALLIDEGTGHAIERGMAWLAQLQQPAGIWPRVPIRRMPADAEISAFVLIQLGQSEQFRQAIRFDQAMGWFESNADALSRAAQTLWTHAKLRCGQAAMAGNEQQTWMWS